jgi:hypothetical protein
VCDGERLVYPRDDEDRAQPAEHEPVDRARVRVALNDDAAGGLAERKA